ncbi:MAG TPA: ABC transporter substrate-binding protein [Polyangiaceae bacterium]|nr:ABC transporter substrate-binding protein [Polyangiaceae bacterium]
MTRVGLGNGAALLLSVVLAMSTATRRSAEAPRSSDAPASALSVNITTLRDGTKALVDRRGRAVPLKHYTRILSGSSLVDELLVALAERDRILAVTRYGHDHSLPAPIAAGLATHPGLGSLESVLALKPDLVITNHIGDPAQLERIEERGIPVFDLGDMRGLATLVPNIHAVATLLGRPDSGRDYADRFARRLRNVSDGAPVAGSCLYVSIYGGQISGGSVGTSYHDVLVAAGFADAAAARYRDWPTYTAEELLALNPDFVLASDGMEETLCRHPGLDRLRVCEDRRRILTLPTDEIGDPGPGMLEAAEDLRKKLEAFRASGAESTR